MRILAIDPGPTHSAILVWDGRVVASGTGIEKNHDILSRLASYDSSAFACIAIEMVACYGMPVGAETFATCLWIGRFIERSPVKVQLVYRKDVKMHLCYSMRAKDSNIRAALIDKYGAPGTKKAPGKTHGISGHLWAALAVADYADQ